MSNNHVHEESKQITFNNNPFTLAFNAMSRAFKINQNPSIAIIVGSIIIGVGNQISNITSNGAGSIPSETDEMSMAIGLITIVVGFVFVLIALFVSTLWAGFTAHVGLKNARHESANIKDSLRNSLANFWKIIGVNLMIGLLVLACLAPAIILAIIGGIFAAVDIGALAALFFVLASLLAVGGLVFAIRLSIARSLSVYAMLDENLGVMASLSRSVELTKQRVMEAWGMAFVGSIIPIVGPLLTACGLGDHYLQLKVYRDNKAELPKVHILSWLPILFIGLLAVLVLFGTFVIFALIASQTS